jgi:hypothetical protein
MIKISSGGRDNMIGGMKAVELGQYDWLLLFTRGHHTCWQTPCLGSQV